MRTIWVVDPSGDLRSVLASSEIAVLAKHAIDGWRIADEDDLAPVLVTNPGGRTVSVPPYSIAVQHATENRPGSEAGSGVWHFATESERAAYERAMAESLARVEAQRAERVRAEGARSNLRALLAGKVDEVRG